MSAGSAPVALHLAALAVWASAAVSYRVLVALARRRGERAELDARRRHGRLVDLEHAALALGLAAGVWLMRRRGWGPGHPGWLGLKVGLTVFLIVPLEALHAWVRHGWLRRGLAETQEPPFSKTLRRGAAVEEMLFALALPLAGLALPLMVWLSLARPF